MSTKLYPEASVEMGDYISVIQRRKVLIAAMTLAGLVLALFYSVILATPTYVSHAEVEVKPIAFDIFGGLNLDREINMGTERELARSDSVAVLAKEKLDTDKSISALTEKVTVSAVGSTQVLAIDCSASTRLGAQECAKAFSEAYIDHRRAQATAQRDNGRANIEAALNPINTAIVQAQQRLAAVPPASPQEAEAEAVLRGLEDQASPYRDKLAQFNTLDVSNPAFVVSPANRPGAASSPKPKTNALMGGFFGFFLGLLVAFGRDRVDGRLRGRVDLEEQLRAPVLATVPRTRRNGRSAPTLVTMQHPHSPASEAYRALRTRMLVMAERRGMKTIMVASPTGEDGKTAIAANLAVSLSQVGKRVVLLSADLRKSSVHTYFGLDNERGLS
ncbi:MAG: Wzz/FepE/Etk N-terminal domain-containing protein, partial [Acidimicrobiia bacterium]